LADFINDTSDLSTLKAAFRTAGSLYVLNGGKYTLLAPNNDAFEVLFEAYPAFANVLFTKPWNLHLSDLLFTHVIEGNAALSTDLNDGDLIETCSGEDITVVKDDESLCFSPSLENAACVEIADFVACNGVAHILNGKLHRHFPEVCVGKIISDRLFLRRKSFKYVLQASSSLFGCSFRFLRLSQLYYLHWLL
jgi:uncharacterized surface protein with fasciclin (FAS1) repeats